MQHISYNFLSSLFQISYTQLHNITFQKLGCEYHLEKIVPILVETKTDPFLTVCLLLLLVTLEGKLSHKSTKKEKSRQRTLIFKKNSMKSKRQRHLFKINFDQFTFPLILSAQEMCLSYSHNFSYCWIFIKRRLLSGAKSNLVLKKSEKSFMG